MRTFVMVLIATLVAGGFVVYRLLQPESLGEPEISATPTPTVKATPEAAPAPAALPHAEEIAAQMNRPLTQEEEIDEEQTDAEQVLEALESLKSKDPDERVTGVEQLAAFPTAEAEQQLVVTMAGDADADVRSAAAQSLGQFETVSDASLDALLKALEDKSEDVQISALDSIESVASDLESDSLRFKKIVAELKKRKSMKKLKVETRQSIKEFLEDQSQ